MTHGRHADYVRGCHCPNCRAGHAAYMRAWDRKRRHPDIYGPSAALIDAKEVRGHLTALRAAGMGRRMMARRAGVSPTVVARLLGLDSSRPARRVHPETARRLLALTMSDAQLVGAEETWRLVDEMVGAGVRRYQIARALGQRGPGLQLGHERITHRNADRVRAIHDSLWRSSTAMRTVCACRLEAISA